MGSLLSKAFSLKLYSNSMVVKSCQIHVLDIRDKCNVAPCLLQLFLFLLVILEVKLAKSNGWMSFDMQQMHSNAVMRPEAQCTSSKKCPKQYSISDWNDLACPVVPGRVLPTSSRAPPFRSTSPRQFLPHFSRDVNKYDCKCSEPKWQSLTSWPDPYIQTREMQCDTQLVGAGSMSSLHFSSADLVAGRLFQPQARETAVQLWCL